MAISSEVRAFCGEGKTPENAVIFDIFNPFATSGEILSGTKQVGHQMTSNVFNRVTLKKLILLFKIYLLEIIKIFDAS